MMNNEELTVFKEAVNTLNGGTSSAPQGSCRG